MNYLSTALMGIVQGIAEFLPISSSGHLALFQHYFGMEDIASGDLFFSVMLHFGTLVSVLVYYRNDVWDMIREFFGFLKDLFSRRSRACRNRGNVPEARRLVLLLIVATLPLFLVLPVKKLVESFSNNITVVSVALLLTGCLLFFSDRLARGHKNGKTATIADVLVVGLAQVFGTVPGISRAGITISTGMLRGFDRSFAVRFSFLMSLPAVLGATGLELIDAIRAGLDPAILPYCAVGMVISGVVGYFAIRLVNLLADRGKFGAFCYYCWAVGILSLAAGFIVK